MSDVELPASHIREQIAAAVDVVVHMARLRDGRRVAMHVSAVEGCRDGEPVVREVFSFRLRGGSGAGGEFVATGEIPELIDILAERGEPLPPHILAAGPDAVKSTVDVARPRPGSTGLERIPIGFGRPAVRPEDPW